LLLVVNNNDLTFYRATFAREKAMLSFHASAEEKERYVSELNTQ